MIILKAFLSSDTWQNISNRVLATFGLSGAATIANAVPEQILEEAERTGSLLQAVQISSIVCSTLSALVAITILFKFVYWYKTKDKIKNNE
jgi:hypothetical protein